MRRVEAKRTEGRPPSPEETAVVSGEAYAFGYPLVLMDVTARSMTSVPEPTGGHAPVNQLAHLREFPDASFTDVVSPNADTMYSTAVLDLRAEPLVLSVPDSHDRYYLMPMLDGWTNVFASPGSGPPGPGRTTSPSSALAGQEHCPPSSNGSTLPRTWCG
jgi:hypothetical protein